MQEGTDSDIYITNIWDIVYKMEDINEPVSESRLAGIILYRLPAS